MSNDGGKQDTGSDAGWSNVQSNKDFNKGNTWSGKSDSEVKQDIETRKETRARETEFQNYNKQPVEYTGPSLTMKVLNWTGNKISQSKFAKDTNLKNRTFFTDKVLSKKGVYDGNTKLSKSEFQSLSLDKQNEIYGGYMEDRMSGKITASGNPGSATRGGPDNDAPPVMLQEKKVGGRTLITEAPTSTEIAEKEEAEKYDARKTKKRGRRRTIFQQGTSKDFTLSKPILLGV